MPASNFGPLVNYQSENLMRDAVEPHGDSVRLDKLRLGGAYQKPTHLYLVYITLDQQGLVVRHLESDINPNQVGTEEDRLIADAIADRNVIARNFDTIKFLKPSYFTIALDAEGWGFYYPDPANPEPTFPGGVHDPIVFLGDKTVITDDAGTVVVISQQAALNRAFYNLEAVTKRIGVNDRKAIRCINFFTRNTVGDPVDHKETLNYCFNILLRIPFSHTLQNQKITVILDPDGQNQGPIP